MSRIIRILTSIVILSTVISILGNPSNAFAKPNINTNFPDEVIQEDECVPLDIVFIIDQSQPMGEADPTGLRLQPVRWFIGLLGYEHLYTCSGNVVNRVGVVSIGGREENRVMVSGSMQEVEIDYPLSTIEPPIQGGFESWKAQLEETIWPNITDENTPKIQRDPQETYLRNIEAGISKAVMMFNNASNIPGPQRKKIIILISANNAVPCTNDMPSCFPSSSVAELENLLQKLPKSVLGFDESVGPFLYVMAFDDSLNQSSVKFDKAIGIWENFYEKNIKVGRYYQINRDIFNDTPKEMAKNLISIYKQYNRGSRLVENCPIFQMESFLDKAHFYILEMGNKIPITFSNDLDPAQVPEQEQYFSELAGGYYVFDQPKPGKWTVDANCVDSVVLWDSLIANQVEANVIDKNHEAYQKQLLQYYEVNAPTQPASDPNNPYHIQVTVKDSEGDLLSEYSGYEAELKGKVEFPGGYSQDLVFSFDNSTSSYISNPLDVHLVGDYKWSVDIFAPRSDSDKILLGHVEGTYNVKQITPISLVIQEPQQNSTYYLHNTIFNGGFNFFGQGLTLSPVPVKVKFEDYYSKENIDVNDVLLPSSSNSIEVTMKPATNNKDTETIQLSPTEDQLLTGSIGNKLSESGEQQLEVNVNSEAININKYRLINPDIQPVKISRTDDFFTNNDVCRIIIVSLFIAALCFVVWKIWQHTNPVQGTLLFFRPESDQPLYELKLGHWRRRETQFYLGYNEKEKVPTFLWDIESIKTRRADEDESLPERLAINISYIQGETKDYEIPFYDNDPLCLAKYYLESRRLEQAAEVLGAFFQSPSYKDSKEQEEGQENDQRADEVRNSTHQEVDRMLKEVEEALKEKPEAFQAALDRGNKCGLGQMLARHKIEGSRYIVAVRNLDKSSSARATGSIGRAVTEQGSN